MPPDFFSGALTSIYATLGVPAAFSFLSEPITVIDKTHGVEAEPGGGAVVPTLVPALCIRASDIAAAGVTLEDFVEQDVTVNLVTWTVVSYRPRPTPRGESKGEYYLYLRAN